MEHHACTNKHCIAADIAWALATPSTLRRHRPQRRRPGAPNISPCSERLPVDSEDPMPHQATAISHHLPKQAQQAPRAEERHWHYGVTVSWTQRPHDSWRRRRAGTASLSDLRSLLDSYTLWIRAGWILGHFLDGLGRARSSCITPDNPSPVAPLRRPPQPLSTIPLSTIPLSTIPSISRS
eukprot:CAMPEP_0181249200 /NCGR_PEP_ID=MMETSP1096-20121128/45621_1 /TAXON_ID=156174 ORGANISM="Chrysochromulina ericina, Strain CCMP281" /NCGR_SAMPLE_ID=MMETSP1096 /ASSEMBLY_ACC=CAM_ASM_000453 /LENGTH=180 /DNA_ID=CAMNT_0023346509 /DNA_START=45 /DNA_END=588 /DNA_ORIENTATION=-